MTYHLVSGKDHRGIPVWGIAEGGSREAYEVFYTKAAAEKELKILRSQEKKQSNPSMLKKLRKGIRGYIRLKGGRLIIKT